MSPSSRTYLLHKLLLLFTFSSLLTSHLATPNIITLTLSGTVTTLSPTTGALLNKFTTAPLLSSHNSRSSASSDFPPSSFSSSSNFIVPGLDGLIYSATASGLELLPFSVLDAQDEPVAHCSPLKPNECTVTWGSHERTLFGLSPQGSVRWIRNDETGFTRRESTWSESREEENDEKEPTLLLQRSDYMVRNVDLTSGIESWNVSVSNYEALDFDLPNSPSSTSSQDLIEYDSANKKVFGRRDRKMSKGLPRIKVEGDTIHAWREGKRLWSKTFDSEVKSIYGVEGGGWVEMEVEVEEEAKALQTYTNENLDLGVLETGEGRVMYVRSPGDLIDSPTPHNPPPSTILLNAPSPVPSHSYRLDSGLFLTWPMITALVCCLITGVLLGGRVAYKKLKRRWMDKLLNTPVAGNGGGMVMKDLMEGEFELGGGDNGKSKGISFDSTPSHSSHSSHSLVNRSVSMPVITSSNGALESDRSDLSMLRSSSNNEERRKSLENEKEIGQVVPGVKEEKSSETKVAKEEESPQDRESPTPQTIYSRYKSEFTEISQLGRGGFGAVYRCLNTLDGREYAIKKVKVKGMLGKVMREVKILASLEHGNIVRYYNAWLEEGGARGKDEKNDQNTASGRDENDTSQSFNKDSQFTSNNSDLGFTWDRGSNAGDNSLSKWSEEGSADVTDSIDVANAHHSLNESAFTEPSVNGSGGYVDMSRGGTTQGSPSRDGATGKKEAPKTLYIQMAYCTQKTLRDFLSSPEQRRGKEKGGNDSIDLSFALSLFAQVARGVKHVHSQSLIHRDLKPSNCFIDNLGTVKIGDFGLSREAGEHINQSSQSHSVAEDQTAGVGTFLYASPEQMDSRDYDASTDVYSLGVMLFELCYEMQTGMERATVMAGVKKGTFPPEWDEVVKLTKNEALDQLIRECVSHKSAVRPTAEKVVERIEMILGKFSVLSLDRSKSRGDGAVLLRVEAKDGEKLILTSTVEMIKSASPDVKIIQYGMRGGAEGTQVVMEFALDCPEMRVSGGDPNANSLSKILEVLNASEKIGAVRQVSEKHKSFDVSD
ncbi:hypothetical protein TrLO_g9488 [Triparma laevis f. longispina]|uniref:non-specific serine/threonine protein kinase n=1 Tax=Triparma laevis f. longispina TaxID=1714387 RepID=A0A9W6Z889_9STRA|nr:hypothetical protein TrLO_g9488 [Triparma laevis f. longispina]